MSNRLEYNNLLSIPRFLRKRREKLCMTQAEVAAQSGVTKRVIEAAEKEDTFANSRGITLISFLRIIRALGLKIQFVNVDENQ